MSGHYALEAQNLPEQEAMPARHGLATFLAFVFIGAAPLLPYPLPHLLIDRFVMSVFLTLTMLFGSVPLAPP